MNFPKIISCCLILLAQFQVSAQINFSGTDFWINSCDENSTLAEYNVIRIIGDVATLGNVSIPGSGFSEDFCFNSGGDFVDIELPYGLYGMTASNVVQNNAIHITTDNNVIVVFFPISGADSDYYTAIPSTAVGQEYYVNMPKGVGFWNPAYSQITATQNNTSVTISNPDAELGPYTWGVGNSISTGSITNFMLNAGESFRFQAGQDVTTGPASNLQHSGTRILSDKPVFVSSKMSTNLPTMASPYSDGLRESLLPRSAWGNRHFTTVWETSTEYLIQIVSADNGNTISFNGVPAATINSSEMFDTLLVGPQEITTTFDVNIVQSSLSKDFTASAAGDPSSFNLLAESNFKTSFHDINAGYGPFGTIDSVIYMLTVPTSAIASTTLNGVPVSPASFSTIGSSSYSNAIVEMTTPLTGADYITFNSSQPIMVYKTGLCRPGGGSSEWQVSRNLGSLNNTPNSNIYDSTCALLVLPVEYIAFTGEVMENQVHLEWSTISEIRNDFFEIERSNDAKHFQTVGRVNGVGTTTETSFYSFTDENPFKGYNYYRLKQVDVDGEYSFSNLISFNIQEQAPQISLHPNPAESLLFITCNLESVSTAAITIYSVSGQMVYKEKTQLLESSQLDISNLKSGTYVVEVITKDQLYREKITKK